MTSPPSLLRLKRLRCCLYVHWFPFQIAIPKIQQPLHRYFDRGTIRSFLNVLIIQGHFADQELYRFSRKSAHAQSIIYPLYLPTGGLLELWLEGGHHSTEVRLCKLHGCRRYIFPSKLCKGYVPNDGGAIMSIWSTNGITSNTLFCV